MHFVIIDINGLVGQEFIGSEKSKGLSYKFRNIG